MSATERLAAKVKAVNRANDAANKLYDHLVAFFTKYIGQEIEKNDGTFRANVLKELGKIDGTTLGGKEFEPHIYKSSGSDLKYCVKTCEMNSSHTCCYHEVMVYIGRMDGKTLVSLHPKYERRTDFTAAEVMALRKDYETKKSAASSAYSLLGEFGEYDR